MAGYLCTFVNNTDASLPNPAAAAGAPPGSVLAISGGGFLLCSGAVVGRVTAEVL